MKNFTKGLLSGLCIGLTISFSAIAFASQPIKLIINGREIQCDVPPQNINGRVLVPARFVAEPLGASVEWDGAKKIVKISSQKKQSVDSSQTNNEIKILKDYYIQSDEPCIEYQEIVYIELLTGINHFNISVEDVFYNQSKKTLTFYGRNIYNVAETFENKNDVVNYRGRIYIKENIFKSLTY